MPNTPIHREHDARADFVGNRDFVASFARGLEVMKAFSNETHPVTVSLISRKTGIPRAAVRRFLTTMEVLGYIECNLGLYRLTPSILRIGSAYLSSNSLPGLAQPVLEAVSSQLDQPTSLSTLDGDDIVYLARHTSSRVLSVGLFVGSRLPAYCTSMGRVLLAALPKQELTDYLDRVKMRKWTNSTVVSRTRLASILAEVAQQRYALVDGELEPGLRSIAVPIKNESGRVIAAMNVGAHISSATTEEMVRCYLPVLTRNVDALSRLL